MKKVLIVSGLMMAAIVALTGCQKEQNFGDRTFSISASVDSGTKTTNDGLSTLWAEKDAIGVFYADAGSSTYSSAIKMTLTDGAGTKSGVFAAADSPEIPAGDKDWYAIYPSGAKSPASTDEAGGYTYLGNRNGLTQKGYDDTSILCGSSCPMYGVAKNVSGTPSFTMKQLATVIEFNVINKTGAAVKVLKVTLDESESEQAIVGSFYVDFTGEKPEFVPSGGSYVSSKAFTSVADAGELAADATAKVYMPLVPYTHDPMRDFKVIVEGESNGDAFTTTVCLKPNAQQSLFEAGKIRRVNVPLEKVEATESNSVADVTSGSVGESYYVKDALVTMVYGKGFFATDGSGTILVFMNAAPAVAKGDKVDISGVTSIYSNMVQFNKPTVTVKSSGNAVALPDPVAYTGSEIDAAAAAATNAYVSLTATMSSATSGVVEGTAASVTLTVNPATDPAVTLAKDKQYVLTGYIYGYYTKDDKTQVYLYADSSEEISEPEPPQPQGTVVSVVMTELVNAGTGGYTVSTNGNEVCYTHIDLSPAVRLSTTGDPNCGSFWGSTTIDWRLYQAKGGNAIITVADGCNLELVEFIFTSSNNGVLLHGDDVMESGKGYECSGNVIEFTVGNTTEKTNGQIKITAVKVIYTGEGTLPPYEEPEKEIQTSISMAGGKTVHVGETVELGATNNADAPMTYESEDTSIATVDGNGVVSGVAVGSVKVWARVAANDGKWTAAEKYCTITVSEAPAAEEGSWYEFGISNIQEGDEFVIVSNGYAMTNANGTSKAPDAVAVTVADNKITSDVTSDIVWTLTGNTTDGFTFYPKGTTEKWLYCNTTAASGSNNNMRVGTGARSVFVMEVRDDKVYLVTKDDKVPRYICLYNNQDWRGYIEASIVPTHTQFFKKAVR